VLAVENNKVLLISEIILEMRPYNVKNEIDITWDACTLRKYLNGEFYNKLGAEKSAIAETSNSNPDNPWYDTEGGKTTADKVFLLSLDELVKYFGDSGDLANKQRKDGDRNAKSDGTLIIDRYNDARIATDTSGRASLWWLRSPGASEFYQHYSPPSLSLKNDKAAFVRSDGFISVCGVSVNSNNVGVRPALWLNL
jgi:hypothetical protein